MDFFTELLNPTEAIETQTAPGLSVAEELAECEVAWRDAEIEYNNACATFRKHAEEHRESPLIFRSGNRMNIFAAVASPETRRLRAVVVAALGKRNALLGLRADLQKKLGVVR